METVVVRGGGELKRPVSHVETTQWTADSAGSAYAFVQIWLFNGNPVKYTDPDGNTASFSISEETATVTIRLDIAIYGRDANAGIAQEYRNRIMDKWGQDNFGNAWQVNINGRNYSVNFDINITVGRSPGFFKRLWNAFIGTTNFINVDNSFPRPNVVNGYLGTWIGGGTPQRHGYPLDVDNIPAHETGHLLGLRDRYHDNRAGISTADFGWDGNIMASTLGNVEQRNINAIGTIISGHGKKGTIRSRNMIY